MYNTVRPMPPRFANVMPIQGPSLQTNGTVREYIHTSRTHMIHTYIPLQTYIHTYIPGACYIYYTVIFLHVDTDGTNSINKRKAAYKKE